MKKSTRILAFLMAFAMLIGSFSVMGSAYEAYKGDAIKNSYNDIDVPEFTTEQAASMALDEVDRMLAKEQIYLNIYVGELDLRSVNYAITSVDNLLTKVSSLLGLLGSASELTIASLKENGDPMQRSTAKTTGNVTDVKFITNLLDFLGDNAGIFEQYVNGTFSLGIMNGFVEGLVFDVRDLVIGLGYSLTEEGDGYDFMDGDSSTIPAQYTDANSGAINLIQTVLNEMVLGDWVMLDEYFDEPWKTANTRYNYYSFAEDYGETEPDTTNYDYYGYKHSNEWVLVGLGGAVRVPAGDPAPDPVFTAVDVRGTLNGYDFIENLIQRAFNYILVPVLNNQTRHALREWCGVEYLDKYTKRTILDEATNTWVENPDYNPDYTGETFDAETQGTVYNDIFNVNAYMDKVTVPEGTTLISNINDIFGNFLGASADGTVSTTGILKNPAVAYADFATGTVGDWTWQFGSNSYLFTNIANVAKYVLQITGDLLFADYVDVPTAEELEAYNDQQVIAFILRAIFNASVDWLYIPDDDENQTILGVAYSAVEQLAYQDIPQYTYDRPLIAEYTDVQDYYDALIDKALDILLDVAVYNLNQSFDANPEAGAKAGEGLIPYQGDSGSWENTAIMVAEWAVGEYGPLVAIYNNLYTGGKTTGSITMENVWTDIDTILDSLIPIVGSSAWISSDISGSKFSSGDSAVSKAFIFDYVLKPVYTLDATNFSKIFDRNTTGSFATMNGVAIIADILDNVFDLLFPNVFKNGATSVDEVLQNNVLGTMVYDLIKSLGTKTFTGKTNTVSITGRANDIAEVALPVVDMILGLSDEQEFEEMEIYLPEVLKVGEAVTFGVYNGSSGINTGYTNASGTFSQDTLYEYSINTVTATSYHTDGTNSALSYSGIDNTTKFSGGDSVDVTIAKDNLLDGDIVEFSVKYTVSGEEEGTTIGGSLTKTVYAYVGSTDKGDDETDKTITLSDDRSILYASEIYLESGDDLDDIENYSIRIQDNEVNKDYAGEDTDGDGEIDNTIAPTVTTATVGTVTNADTTYPFVGSANPDAAELSGQDGLYFLNPFKLATKADGTYYEKFEENYQVDEEGNVVVDETTGEPVIDETNPNNGGVVDGDYVVTVPVTVGSETNNLTITIHLYDDFGLPGAFDSAVAKNRQQSEYDTSKTEVGTLWANYVSALKNAAKLALTPKSGANFQTFIGKNDTSDDYENYYEKYALELEAAIEALEPYALQTGVDGIKNIIAGLDGYNYETRTFNATVDGTEYTFSYKVPLEYYEEGYTFFGERDYIPYLYDRYRDARGNGQSLIDSQEIYVKAPFTDVDVYGEDYEPSDEEVEEYNKSLADAVERINNPVIIGSTEAAYAQHMLELTSGRLIRLEANKDKLADMLAMCANDRVTGEAIDLTTGASKYTSESWENYTNALTFATAVNEKSTTDALGNISEDLTPTEVNIAMSELIEAWKKLVESCDFTALDAELALSAPYADLTADGATQDTYTEDSYATFIAAYEEAYNVDRMMGKTEANQEEIDALTAALTAAREGLVEAAAAEPTWALVTATPSGSESYFQDKTKKNTFVPTLMSSVSENKHQATWFASPLAEDGTTVVDDFIIGVGANLNATAAAKIIDEASLNNCYVKYTTNAKNKYSTGALIQICKSSDDSVIKTYQIIHYGEVVADGRINNSDVTNAKLAVARKVSYKNDKTLCAYWASMDVDGNGRLNNTDYLNIKKYNTNKVTFDQVNVDVIAL